jgi:hypothetical protein
MADVDLVQDLEKALLKQLDPWGCGGAWSEAFDGKRNIAVDVGNGSGATAYIDIEELIEDLAGWWAE